MALHIGELPRRSAQETHAELPPRSARHAHPIRQDRIRFEFTAMTCVPGRFGAGSEAPEQANDTSAVDDQTRIAAICCVYFVTPIPALESGFVSNLITSHIRAPACSGNRIDFGRIPLGICVAYVRAIRQLCRCGAKQVPGNRGQLPPIVLMQGV